MPDFVRNWRQWEMDERLAFYKRRDASIGGRMPTEDELRAWREECDRYIERERMRIMAAQSQAERETEGEHGAPASRCQ